MVMAFEDAARLGVVICELALRYVDAFDAIAESRFRELERERAHWRALAFAAQKWK